MDKIIEIKENSVAAIVITYNRLEMLKKVIKGLQNQTRKVDKIIIINNSSTDGTKDWLENLSKNQENILVITQPNTGSSGGQYTGIETAYNLGYEWIWTMDDDVVAEAECLENLLLYSKPDFVSAPLRIAFEGDILFGHDIIAINMKNPFKSIWTTVFTKKIWDHYKKLDVIFSEGITFEGPIFHRTVIDKIGLVEKNFFIYADDTEFCIRMKNAGIKAGIVKKAVFNKQIQVPKNIYEFNWKSYYYIRNLIAMDVLHGNFFVRWLRPFGYTLVWLTRCKNFDNIKTVFKALKDGYFYKSSLK